MGDWACRRCGICCKSIAGPLGADGHAFGLYLDPSEVGLFPKEAVFPLLGRGDPVETIAWQLGVMRCPNYAEEDGLGRCLVRDQRPLACRKFPVVGRYRVNDLCPGIRSLSDGVWPESLGPELAAYEEEIRRDLVRAEAEFVWPLDMKRWVRKGEIR